MSIFAVTEPGWSKVAHRGTYSSGYTRALRCSVKKKKGKNEKKKKIEECGGHNKVGQGFTGEYYQITDDPLPEGD